RTRARWWRRRGACTAPRSCTRSCRRRSEPRRYAGPRPVGTTLRMSYLVYALLAAGAGACIALQASANSRFRHNLGDKSLFAAFFSICGTFATAVTVMLVVRPPAPSMDEVRQTQWWNWIGGPLGALIVLAGAALVTHLSAAVFI